MRGGWAGTQPVIPALWSSLTKHEAGTAQPARTHTYTNTQTVTQIHTDREVQGSTTEHAPTLDPLVIPRAKGHTLAVGFQAAAGNTLSLALSYMHTHKHTPRE